MDFYDSPAYGKLCGRIHGIDLKQMSMVTRSELEIFLKEISVPPGSKILDLGCSVGHFSDYISKRYCSHVTGIDISKDRIDYAKEKFADMTALDFIEMDFNELPFEPSSFDLIYSFDTIHFTQTVEKMHNLLDRCMELLKPGGELAVFWMTNPSGYNPELFELKEPAAQYTPVGIWGSQKTLDCRTFDLTEQAREFYINALKECHNLQKQLEAEIPEVYQVIENEFSTGANFSVKGDDGGIFRWLYVFRKPLKS